jgi:hypothetical protein
MYDDIDASALFKHSSNTPLCSLYHIMEGGHYFGQNVSVSMYIPSNTSTVF